MVRPKDVRSYDEYWRMFSDMVRLEDVQGYGEARGCLAI
jgi:hypothetical protein